MAITVTFRHDPAELEQADASTLADELPDELTSARSLAAELRSAEDGDNIDIDLDIDAAVVVLLTLLHIATRTRTGQQRELPSPGLRDLRRILERGIWPRAAKRL